MNYTLMKYLRISSEDVDLDGFDKYESNSIANQRALVKSSERSVISDMQTKTDERNSKKRGLELKLKNLELSQETALEQYLEEEISKNEYQAMKKETADLIQEVTQLVERMSVA